MNGKAILVTALVLSSFAVWAQNAPKPGPEVKKLDYFVGSWTTEGTIGQGPWGAGGKFRFDDTMEWMSGNFFVVGHSDFKMPQELGGEGKEIILWGYDTTQNLYTYDVFNSLGERESFKGTLSGDTWTWTGEMTYEGEDMKHRMTMKVLSPASYNMKLEISMDGTTWMPFMEAKATKK